MAAHKIAIIKGDGMGVDVSNEGMKVLGALEPKCGITVAHTGFQVGSS